MMKGKRFILRLMVLLLMAGGMANSAWNGAWAADVTYHILTLPIDPSVYDYHMKGIVTGWRLEAVKVVAKGQTIVELPAEYKSPLATGFTYYAATDANIVKYNSGAAQNLFANGPIKGVLYQIKGVDNDDTPAATPVAEGTALSGNEYYVVYTYNASNTIAQLDGSVKYNIHTKYKDNGTFKDKGFFALNRGRNNRPAILPTANVNPEILSSDDFIKASAEGTKISTYWKDNNNKNDEKLVGGQFFFGFKFEGEDPYNIIIRTTYAKDTTYIEKNEGTNNFVYKWYKEGSLFAVSSNNNCYIASDEHKQYTTPWVPGAANPPAPDSIVKPGYYHGQNGVVWNSFTLLNNSSNDGYVFMGTRTVDGNGAIQNNLYYLKEKDNYNNLNFATGNSTDNLTIEGIYPIEKVTFKIATPFYDPESPSDAHIVSVEDQVSKYTVDHDQIETKYLPAALKRKYISFSGNFYKDAAHTQPITHFSQAIKHATEGYQVYVGYDVSPAAPKFISPSASYTTATWYELTDGESSQEHGRKIKYDDTNEVYKNNGANGEYTKASEFAFVGDPYELKVLYRKGTETAGANRYVTLSTHDTWDMPHDATEGSFLLRKYKDANEGKWAWDAGETSVNVAYGTDDGTPSVDKNAQTVKINLSGLNGSKYYKISTGGAGASQIESVTPSIDNVSKVPGTTMTIVVQLKENTSGANKVMTVSIQEYNDAEGNTPFGSSSDITITQGTGASSFTGNTVSYSMTSSTRVKVLNLPKVDISYNVVDKSGRIAVKATANQTIFSPISLATMPSIIVSPFILDETVTFYDDNYVDGAGRNTLTHEVTETSNVADDIFVTYTTARLDNKPIKLSENQEFNVLLNGHYLWYDASDNSVKTDDAPGAKLKSNAYLWKLRNRDPYAMLVDNLDARQDLGVAGQDETVTVYDDAGTGTSATRQKGAWVKLASSLGNDVGLTFDVNRANAQPFVAKASVQTGVYEVMVATGASVDALTTYYNIGCTAENTVKIYDNAHYLHGNDVLKFRLEQTIPYTYHLIDKQHKQLLELTSQSPDLALPGDYQSPLVATYHFYDQDNMTISSGTYTVKTPATELTSIYDLNATYDEPTSSTAEAYNAAASDNKHEATSVDDMKDKAKALTTTGHHYYKISDSYYDVNITKANYSDIYVTYDVNDVVKFNTGQYMLKFLEPLAEGYHLEDGNDRLTSTKIQAVYPYCNGDGNLNIYGEDMQKEQFHGGASTRPRWVWYFDSENNDPYHVRIRSRSTISYNSVSHNTYLTTYAVHFNQDALASTKHIVTGGTLPGVASAIPTEYMVLGSAGNYKLMTTETVDDGTTNERRKVTSFEQYWKTYNMLKLCVLGINKNTNAYSDDPTTWVVPEDKRTELNTQLETLGVGSGNWHSYNAYANATRWNGYNDKSDGSEKKVVENIEHWFQTFTMGNGTFDIESAEIPPVLVLLDLHGWEIMRLPLPTKNYPEGDDELAALRAYDSPLVKEYKFYSQATKATGCHKYTLRMQNGAERDQIKVNGKHYTSTSLGDLPPRSASGVISGGAFNDQFVTYTVKEEYAKSYTYHFTDNGDGSYTESGTPSKFLVLLRSRFFRENTGAANASYFSKPIYEASDPVGGNIYDAILDPCQQTVSNVSTNVDENKDGIIDDLNLWYIQPNLNIDKEMGIKWGTSDNINDAEPLSEYGTKKKYKDITGFDPYNIQLQNVNDSRFVTSHQTSTNLHDGILIGDYTGSGGTTNMSLEAEHNYAGWDPAVATGSEGYDHTNLTISNQTFMAVSDANGNMQLMPRFDHTKRVNLVNNSDKSYTTLQAPENHAVASADKNSSMGTQTIFFVRAQRLEYHIINNKGQEALRYKRTGDYYPAITDHFKSPIATDFTYYTGLAEGTSDNSDASAWEGATGDFKRTLTSASLLTDAIKLLPRAGTYYYRIGTRGSFTYKVVTVTTGLLDKQITGSLAAAGLNTDYDCEIQVRYKYDANADHDGDRVLEGKWFTAKLANKDLQADGTVVVPTGDSQGTGVNLYAGDDKPATIDEDDKKWQWKFLAAPADPISDYYEAPDPYDILIFNRHANYTTNPSADPSPMAIGIKVPNADNGANHFALLSHSEGGYALAVTGLQNYTYKFLNGASMTIPSTTAANIVTETDFKQKAGIFTGVGSQLILNDDVQHQFTYRVINNANILSVSASQNNEEADAHEFFPHLPESAQTPLLNDSDYLYYGFARSAGEGKTAVIEQTILYTLYGLYDDIVFVRYNAYDMDKTSFKVPNMRNETGTGQVARNPSSIDVAMNINGGLPYNIVWYSDNMMKAKDSAPTDGIYDAIDDGGSHTLSGDPEFIWYFTGNDPYALKIKHKGGSYANGTGTLVAEGSAPTFMLLKKTGYDYGILQKTGLTDRLSGYGQTTVTTDPTKYILFGLSIHDLIYHLIIANTGETVDIAYRATESGTLTTKTINGTTQRDLTSVNTGEGTHVAGEKYQLGTTETWNGQSYTYCKDVGPVSIGDELVVPNEFLRPNCTFEFYIEGVYHHGAQEGQPYTEMNNKYKGLKLDKLMSDEQLIDQNVVVNIVYSFDQNLATNTGLGFVTSTDQNLWYTFETQSGATPYLAHYTNAWGLQSMAGRETHYTNDYIWTPLGDVYGFKMYNRYMLKNSGGIHNVMTMSDTIEGQNLLLAEPSTTEKPTSYPAGYEIFELVSGDVPGYFRVHPVVNIGATKYYVYRDPSDNYTKLSTTPCDWRFGLEMDLLEPYYERAGYVGGLTDGGKTAYETAVAGGKIIDIQNVVYNDANIVHYTPGYYRMHSQPGVSGISPVRYASGYLHDIEKTHVSGGIPMHFFSKEGVSAVFDGDEDDLNTGFTITPATRGDVPIDPTETDPSTIFYFNGNTTLDGNPRSTIQTQGLYVAANPNGDANNGTTTSKKQRAVMSDNSANAITFSLMDIGGAVLLIHDGAAPATRRYLNYDQSVADSIYDLRYYHESPTDDAKWCLKPVQKTGTAGNGEMPLQIATHNGGDGYYYATFYAPFDVLLPADGGGATYNAYTCSQWYDDGVHPVEVPATNDYLKGKFVPAGTPVIIRVKDESGTLTLTLPSTSPSTPVSCVFKGSYLEQMLAADASHDVYTLGLPFATNVTIDRATGVVTAPLAEQATTGIGFYINATYNKEFDALESLWQRNNRYVLHNKVYYRATGGAGAPEYKSDPQYIPVLFGDEELPDEQKGNTSLVGESGIYDILGRRYNTLPDAPGIYIVNGQKIIRL